jgi:hypothetical protein
LTALGYNTLGASRGLGAGLGFSVLLALGGVIINLVPCLPVHTPFAPLFVHEEYGTRLLLPVLSTLDLGATAITLFAGVLYFKFNQGVLRTIGGGVVAGIVYTLLL